MTVQRGDDRKHDHGKPMWDLLPLKLVEHTVDVLTFGVTNTTNQVVNVSPCAKSPDTMSGKSVRPADSQENPEEKPKLAQTKSNRRFQEKTKVSEALSDQPDTTRAQETPLKRPSMPLKGQFKPVSIPLKDSQNTRSKP